MALKNTPTNAWTLDELAQKSNEELLRRGLLVGSSVDSRMADTITVRNLRRLVSVGAVSAPSKLGREAYYGPHHLDEVVAARDLMTQGFSASAVKSLREKSVAESEPLFYSSHQAQVDTLTSKHAFYKALDASVMQFSVADAVPLDLGSMPVASPLPSRPLVTSTALATHFLDALQPKHDPMRSGAVARPGLLSVSASASASALSHGPSALATSMLTQAYSSTKTADALATPPRPGSLEALEYAEALAQKKASSCTARAAVDVQPWPGLRITVWTDAASGPLTDLQKQQALSALESAWFKATMMARLGLDDPSRLGPGGFT